MAGAIAAGLQAISSKSTDPRMTMLFTFLGVGLAFFASAPRDPTSSDRISDKHDEHATARMNDEHG